jgi:MOSC domain-containing protein YiiM
MTVGEKQVIGRLFSVHVGPIAPLGSKKVLSGFVKHSVDGSVSVAQLGLEGDHQADLSVHGGPEKAVYGYGVSNYDLWRTEFPQHAEKLVPGGLGENLAIEGQNEESVFIGDIISIGSAILQVCQPRQPCFKFALRFEDNRMPGAMMKNGRSGWYYRVLETGVLTAGDPIYLNERPNPAWPMSRFVALITSNRFTEAEAEEIAAMPGLASSWRAAAKAQSRPST